MMAAKGAIYPVFELMRDQSEPFSPAAYLPAVTGYYSDVAGNMLSFPFNRLDADPLLQQGPVPRRRPRPGGGAEDLGRGRRAAKRLRARGLALRAHHILALLDQCREFFRVPQSAAGDPGQRLRRSRCGADFQQSADGAPHRATRGVADARKFSTTAAAANRPSRAFRRANAESSSARPATRADIKANSKFEVGYGMIAVLA